MLQLALASVETLGLEGFRLLAMKLSKILSFYLRIIPEYHKIRLLRINLRQLSTYICGQGHRSHDNAILAILLRKSLQIGQLARLR